MLSPLSHHCSLQFLCRTLHFLSSILNIALTRIQWRYSVKLVDSSLWGALLSKVIHFNWRLCWLSMAVCNLIFYALHNSAGSFVCCPILVSSWGFRGPSLRANRSKIVLLAAKRLQFAVLLFSTLSFLHVVLLLKQFRFLSLIFWVMQAVHGLSV